jgi:phosphoglycolate phosphatase-like HAD superfamily hydrolase
LNGNNILHYFVEVIGADLTIRGKPFPDPINLALKKLNFKLKEDVFFIGDSINDLIAARAASVFAVLLWRKQQEIPQKMQKYADLIIPNLYSLLKII